MDEIFQLSYFVAEHNQFYLMILVQVHLTMVKIEQTKVRDRILIPKKFANSLKMSISLNC